MSDEVAFESHEVRSVLENILASPQFASSPQVSATLRYVVEEALEGRSDRIKAYSIAIDVLKKTDEFDPSSNPIVRVLAGRLREALTTFYVTTTGLDQKLVITIPIGSYVPVFTQPAERTSVQPDESSRNTANTPSFSRTVAIEKFDVFSGETTSEVTDVRSDMVSAGLQIELIDKLSRFKDFVILEVSGGSNVHTLNQSEPQYILSGNIRISEARIIVTPVLRRSADRGIIWSKAYDELFQNTDALFDIQAMIASGVAATIAQPYGTIVTKTTAIRPRLGEMDMDHYLALVDYYQYSNNKSDKKFDEVVAGLERATSELPEFSSAWAALSCMYIYGGQNVDKQTNAKAIGAKGLEAAQKAVNTDPENAMAYQYLAIAKFNHGDHEGFRKAARTALRLNPNDAEVLADMGSHFIQLDNSDEGKEMVEKAMQLSPGHPPWYHLAVVIYHYTRNETNQAIHHARQYVQEKTLSAYILLTASLVQGNHMEEAAETFQTLLENRPIFATDYQSILDNWPLPDKMQKVLLRDLKSAGLQDIIANTKTAKQTPA